MLLLKALHQGESVSLPSLSLPTTAFLGTWSPSYTNSFLPLQTLAVPFPELFFPTVIITINHIMFFVPSLYFLMVCFTPFECKFHKVKDSFFFLFSFFPAEYLRVKSV